MRAFSIFGLHAGVFTGIGWTEVSAMDLKNNQITIGELLADPRARQVLERRFPHLAGRPIVAASRGMTLDRAMRLGAAYVPRQLLRETLRELQNL